MSLKRTLRFACLLALLLAAHFYMQFNFSSTTIMYELGTIKNTQVIENAYKVYPNATFNWEMKTPDYALIMTTGNDQLHTRKTALTGGWVNPFGQSLTLSQSVASRLLKTDIANHQTIKILDKPYLLNRVIKEGDAAYIPYSEALLNKGWQRTRLYYTADSIETVELTDEKLANLLDLWGVKIYNKTFYKHQTLLFYNCALLLCLYVLLTFFRKTLSKLIKQKDALITTRQRYLPFYGLKTFVKGEYRALLTLCLHGVWGLIQIGIGFRLLTNLILPTTLVPSNWFSLSSYLDIGRQFINDWLFQIQNGFAPVSQATLLWLSLLTLYLLVFDKLLFKNKSHLDIRRQEEKVGI